MTLPLDLSAFFSGTGLSYSAEGLPDGLAIDPATGVVSGTPTSAQVRSVTVTASNASGAASGSFTWTIAAAAAGEAPANVSPPAIVGAPRVGTTLSAEPGIWSGTPAPGFAFAWLRDGAPIAGATGATYRLVAADDLATVSVRVTASNASGSAQALGAGVEVRYPAPTAAGQLADRSFGLAAGSQTVDAAPDFTGAVGGTWSVTGAGASIDQAGRVAIPTALALAGAIVTVGYANSGGSAASAFQVTVAESGLGVIEVTSGALGLPDSHAVRSDATGAVAIRLPAFTPNSPNTLWTEDMAFFVPIEIPWRSFTKGTALEYYVFGNYAGGTLANSMALSVRQQPDNATHVLSFKVRPATGTHSVEIDIGPRERGVAVFRYVHATQTLNAEFYAAGARVAAGTTTLGDSGKLRNNSVLIGANGSGTLAIDVSGARRAFPGAIGGFYHYVGTTAPADFEAISLGVAPETRLAPAAFNICRRFTGLDAASLAGIPGTGDTRAPATIVGTAGAELKGSDILPARAGAAAIAADYVQDGYVWGVAPGATTATIRLSGRAEGVAGGVEARVFDADGQLTRDWTALAGASIAGGSWSGTLEAPLNTGWGHLDVRPTAAPDAVHRTRTRLGVGYKVAFVGQSQVQRCFTYATLGLAPSSGAALSTVWQSLTSGAGTGKIGLTTVSAGNPFSDGMAGLAGALPIWTRAPVCAVQLAEDGTSINDLLDDSRTGRAWSDLAATVGFGGADVSAGVLYWSSGRIYVDAAPDGQVSTLLKPFFEGVAPSNGEFAVDHSIRDGAPLGPGVAWSILPMSPRVINDATAQDASGTTSDATAIAGVRAQHLAYAAAAGLAVGPWTDSVRNEPNGPHQDPASVEGHPRTAIRLFAACARALGLDTTANPTLGLPVRSGATLAIPVIRPQGGALQTQWSFAGDAVPAGRNPVQGFEVSEDGGATWSRGDHGASAIPFAAAIAGGQVVLTRGSGSWVPGTRVRYMANGPLDYGQVTYDQGLIKGALYEAGPLEAGLGLPVAGLWQATAA